MSSYNEVINKIYDGNLEDYLDQLDPFREKCKSKIKKLIDSVNYEYFNQDRFPIERIIKKIQISFYLDEELTIEFLKREKILRIQNNDNEILSNLLKSIIENHQSLNLNESTIRWFNSIIAFSSIWTDIIDLEEDIKNKIDYYISNDEALDTSFIKTVLAICERYFATRYYFIDEENEADFISPEEYISSASSLINYYKTIKDLSDENDRHFLDEKLIQENFINEIIFEITDLNRLKEYEVDIIHFGYICEVIDKEMIIKSFSNEVQKSIRFGHFNSTMQQFAGNNDFYEENSDKILSLFSIIELLEEKIEGINIEEIDTFDCERYRFIMNEGIVAIFKHFVEQDAIFLEEASYLYQLSRNLVIKLDDILTFEIIDDITIFDYIKFHRLIFFYNSVFFNKINTEEKFQTDELKILRSLIIDISSDRYQIFKMIFDAEKINKILEIISIDLDDNYLVDLQYNPVLNVNNRYYLPFSIISRSNYIRNLFLSQRIRKNKRFNDSGKIDHISDLLASKFEEYGFYCKKGYDFTYNEKNSDIDLLIYKDGELFLFEVKNSILPTNAFELRTSFDYINKASDQLTLSRSAFLDKDFLSEFNIHNENKIPNIKNIVSSIIITNRIFAGLEYKGFEVLNCYEILNMITNGIVNIQGEKKVVRDTSQLSAQDLNEIICGKYSFTKNFLKTLVEADIRIELEDMTIVRNDYKVDFDKYIENAKGHITIA